MRDSVADDMPAGSHDRQHIRQVLDAARAVAGDDHSDNLAFPVDLRRRRTANSGWEWYFALGSQPVYPNEHRVGVFTDPDVTPEEAFRRVLAAWGVA